MIDQRPCDFHHAFKSQRFMLCSEFLRLFGGAYDVLDSASASGHCKRAGLQSTFMQGHWRILDAEGQQIAELEEDAVLKALLRRFIFVAGYAAADCLALHSDQRAGL